LEKLFKLKQFGTNTRTEIIAGLTTFFTMAYIIFVNPSILKLAGTADNPFNPSGIFVATIISAAVGTLIMAFVANVPYALAPGMGLNAFFTFTVCGVMGFTWQTALAMVFICGVINIIITVTGFRKTIIKSLPRVLQNAIGAGIGLFIAYIGVKDAGLLQFTSDPFTYSFFGNTATSVPPDGTIVAGSGAVPAFVPFSNPAVILALVGVILMIVLLVRKVKGAILIGIVATTVIGVIMIACGVNPQTLFSGNTDASGNLITTASGFFHSISITPSSIASSLSGIKDTAFKLDFGGLVADPGKTMLALTAIIAFILTDIFDALGTFIGTGRRAGIFDANDEKLLTEGRGIKSRLDRALFADLSATIVGSLFGTSNTTTYVESSAGIAEGGRTGLTSVVTALMFVLCLLLAPIIGLVPSAATAPALIVVGVMMIVSIADIDWHNFEEAAVAFLAAVMMPFSYSITNGIAFGFIFYAIIKLVRGKAKEIHPVMAVFTVLFILNFVLQAVYLH